MRVLIVDDSPIARHIISSIISIDNEIQIIGYAENGKEAIELNKILQPDIILMDVEMPEMDGITATQLIMHEDPTPIAILTEARYDGPTVSLANDAGALWVIDKPQLCWSMEQRQDFCGHLKFLASTPLPKYK